MYRTTRVIKWLDIVTKPGLRYEDLTGGAGQDKCDLITDHQIPCRCMINGLRSHLVS